MQRIIAIFIFIITCFLYEGLANLHANTNRCEFSEVKVQEYRSGNDFFYLETEENQPDYYSTYGSWIQRILAKIFGNSAARVILENFHYIILAIAFIILFLYFRKVHLRTISYGETRNNHSEIKIESTEIQEINFEEQIAQAIADNNFRLAIRYEYLNMLKKLSNANIIQWEAHKTNYDYFLEIKNQDTKNNYQELSVIYEYAWYGNRLFSKNQYNEIANQFHTIKI